MGLIVVDRKAMTGLLHRLKALFGTKRGIPKTVHIPKTKNI